MSRLMMLKTVIPCALLNIVVGPLNAVAAVAAQPDDAPTRRVFFGDLDLTRDTGLATLYSRIQSAARAVCRTNDSWESKLLVQSYECTHQAVAHAVADVQSAALTDYYLAKTKPGTGGSASR